MDSTGGQPISRIPSAKSALAFSSLRFSNGKTAIDFSAIAAVCDTFLRERAPRKRCLAGSNADFTGGEFVFSDVDVVIIPKPGLLAGFPSNHKFVYAVPKVLSGKRYSLPVWFSVDSTKAMQV